MSTPDTDPRTPSDRPTTEPAADAHDDAQLDDAQLQAVSGGGFWDDFKEWLGYPDPQNPTGGD